MEAYFVVLVAGIGKNVQFPVRKMQWRQTSSDFLLDMKGRVPVHTSFDSTNVMAGFGLAQVTLEEPGSRYRRRFGKARNENRKRSRQRAVVGPGLDRFGPW